MRSGTWRSACSTSEPAGLAVFDAGKIVAFGDPYCAERLRARLPELAPLAVADLEIRAVPHPAAAAPGEWILERPDFDLLIRRRSGGPDG